MAFMKKSSDEQTDAYIGVGLAFPVNTNVQGNFQLRGGTDSIESSIRIILGTRLGERVYRPNFGSRLSEVVFEPMNTQTLAIIRLYVREALELWEPRIDLIGIMTEPNLIDGLVNIAIAYRPKGHYDIRNMVYPFYLKPVETVR